MQQIRALIQLLEKGYSLRAISAQLGISRQPVTSYAARLKKANHSLQELRQLSDNDLANIVYGPASEVVYPDDARRQEFTGCIPYFLTELKRTGVTRLLLWEQYRKEYNNPYRYTQFCILLKEAGKLTQATMHLVHSPAAMIMVDFAGDKMSYVDRSTGEVIFCPVLVCVLPFSKYTFAIALEDATIPQVIKALNSCLQYLGGVPLSLKTDNMKQVVTKSCRYEPVFTEALQQWAVHYNITLLATRVAKPKDKSAVENEVKIAYQRIYAPLRDQVFSSFNELNAAIQKQLALHNEKLFQLKDHSRLQQFMEQERSLLQPLPPDLFVVKHQAIAKVQKNYHITLGENYHHYSVPYQFIGKQVSVVYDTDLVEVYFLHQRIALHRRSYKKHDFTTVGNHMPAGHQQFFEQQGWTPSYFLEQASHIGAPVQVYMDEVLKSRAFTEQTYNACRGILRLHKEYGATRLAAACARALNGRVFNYRTIQNILVSNQDQLGQVDQNDVFRVPDHSNLRGPDAYQ
ncbi:MAG: IS21 family transposase [Flavisolibacter sp.]